LIDDDDEHDSYIHTLFISSKIVGQYQVSESSSQCIACPIGTFTSNTASSSCSICDIGKYNPSTGQAKCLSCNQGMV
jgi:hypothetical protein